MLQVVDSKRKYGRGDWIRTSGHLNPIRLESNNNLSVKSSSYKSNLELCANFCASVSKA
jgi:ribosomal protein S16